MGALSVLGSPYFGTLPFEALLPIALPRRFRVWGQPTLNLLPSISSNKATRRSYSTPPETGASPNHGDHFRGGPQNKDSNTLGSIIHGVPLRWGTTIYLPAMDSTWRPEFGASSRSSGSMPRNHLHPREQEPGSFLGARYSLSRVLFKEPWETKIWVVL